MNNFLEICDKNLLKKYILNFNLQDFLPPGIKIKEKLKKYFIENKLNEKEINEIIYPLIIFIKEFYKFDKLNFNIYEFNKINISNSKIFMILDENANIIVNNNVSTFNHNLNFIIFHFS